MTSVVKFGSMMHQCHMLLCMSLMPMFDVSAAVVAVTSRCVALHQTAHCDTQKKVPRDSETTRGTFFYTSSA